MKVGGVPYRAIFTDRGGTEVRVINQTLLPHRFETIRLESSADAARAIRDMVVRGAPLIGATAAYGVALAMRADPSDAALKQALALLASTRPTAVNLRWALDAAGTLLRPLPRRARGRGPRLRRPALRGRCVPQPRHRRARPGDLPPDCGPHHKHHDALQRRLAS